MKDARRFVLILVTAPDRKTARRLAQEILTARLAACVNILPGLESHYWWQGRLENAREFLLLIKTTARRRSALEKLILTQHPYDTPEILQVSLSAGTPRYLRWLATSVESVRA